MRAPYRIQDRKTIRAQDGTIRGTSRGWKPPDEEWLRYHYLERNLSMRELAHKIGCSYDPIKRWLEEYGIKKPKEQLAKNHSKRMSGEGNPAWNGGTSRNGQKALLKRSDKPQRCSWCGATRGLQVHHLDHDPMNGDLDNLEWLCGPCNRLESHIKALEDAGRAISVMFEGALHVYFTEHNQ